MGARHPRAIVAALLLTWSLAACSSGGDDDAAPAAEPADAATDADAQTGEDSAGGAGTTNGGGNEGGDETATDGGSADGATGAGTTTSTTWAAADTPVGRFAQAVIAPEVTDAVVPGSSAEIYLSYLTRMTELTGIPVGTIAELTEERFVLDQGAGQPPVVYDDFEITDRGITGAEMSDRPLLDVVSSLRRPVEGPKGVEIEAGSTFTSYGDRRVVLVTVHNGGETTIGIDPGDAAWVEPGGFRQQASDVPVGGAVELAPGDSADVVNTFTRGDGDPIGVLEQAMVPVTGDGPAPSFVLEIPMGRPRPTFFEIDDDGGLRGRLDADLAFDTDSAVPSDEALEILYKATQELLAFEATAPICVAGHADSVGDADHNEQLSRARAEAVAEVLADQGVPNDLDVRGYGEALAPGDEQPDPASRRVDVILGDCPTP